MALQIDALRELCCERDIRNRLGKLPKTLKKAYDELYDKIQSQKESAPIIANRAFQWVMCSCWPLSPAELVAAISQNPDTDEVDEVDINIKGVLGACHNLLVVDQELNICRFSHLSVQEYFEDYHWKSCETDSLVGQVCLSLLINSSTSYPDAQYTEKTNRDRSAHDILEYACLNWVTHVQRLEEKGIIESRLTALLKHFLGSMDQSSLAYQNWYEMLRQNFDNYNSRLFQDYRMPLYQVYDWLYPCSQASLAIVAFGFHKTIPDWWTVEFAEIDQTNSSGESFLMLGAMAGSVSIAEDSLKKGADINAAGGLFGSALQTASFFGHSSVVQLLVDKGADIGALGGECGSALQAASHSGIELTVQMFLENGADVNTPGGIFGSALQAASSSGHESIVQLLLNKGADANGPEGKHGSALQATLVYGAESVVQLLLDRGADVNMSGGQFGSSLQAASYFGRESVV